MSDEKWAKFFDLMEEIVNGKGAFQEKLDETVASATEQNRESVLEEFVGWFDGTIPVDEPDETE